MNFAGRPRILIRMLIALCLTGVVASAVLVTAIRRGRDGDDELALLTVHDVASLLDITPCAVRTAITRHEIPWTRSASGACGIPVDFQQHRAPANEARDLAVRGAVTFMVAVAITLVVAIAVGVLPARSATPSVDYRDLTPSRHQPPSCVHATDGASPADLASSTSDNTADPCGP